MSPPRPFPADKVADRGVGRKNFGTWRGTQVTRKRGLSRQGSRGGKSLRELGVSVSAVTRMEGKALHPQLVDGTWLFSHEEVLVSGASRSRPAPY